MPRFARLYLVPPPSLSYPVRPKKTRARRLNYPLGRFARRSDEKRINLAFDFRQIKKEI
jgi:hypothetical protein